MKRNIERHYRSMYEAERRDHNISVAIYTVLIVSLCIVVLLMSLGGAVAQ